MSLQNAIGDFLIGNTDPNSDGLAVSTGIGEGQAQVLKPYSGQAWQNAQQLKLRNEELDLQKQKQAQADQAPKNDLLKQLGKINGYRPQEFKNVKLRHDKLVQKTLSLDPSAPDYVEKLAEIQSGILAYNEGVNASRDIKKAYEDVNAQIQNGQMYYDPKLVEELKKDYEEDYGIIDDDYQWVDKLGIKAGKATAFRSTIPLIKDKSSYLKGIINSTSKEYETGNTYRDPNSGEIRRETVIRTDPKALDERLEMEAQNPQIVGLFGSVDEFKKQAKNAGFYAEKSVSKLPPSSSTKSVSGGGIIEVGKFRFSPQQKYSYEDKAALNAALEKYKKGVFQGRKAEGVSGTAMEKASMKDDEFKSKFGDKYTKNLDVHSYSIAGVAENSPHKFIIVDKGGNDIQIKGTSTLYDKTSDSFIVQNEDGTFFAPVKKNSAYLTDGDATIASFYDAIGQTKGGNVVTTGKSGKVIGKEKSQPTKFSDNDVVTIEIGGKKYRQTAKVLREKGYNDSQFTK